MTPFVILDRDGVINFESPNYIKSIEEWRPLAGSLEAIAQLSSAGYQVFVATNQAGVARGKLSLETLHAIHQRMIVEVENYGGKIDGIQYCPHHPDEQCKCRKPKPGMLFRLARDHKLDLANGYFVGDSMTDLQAAKSAGCKGVLVLSGNTPKVHTLIPSYTLVYSDLAAFVNELLDC